MFGSVLRPFVSASLVIAASLSSATPAAAASCDASRWPLSAIQTKFSGAAPAIGSGDALPSLGAPVTVNLSLQSEVVFPHPPGRQGKANPAYAAIVKLGPEPAATYQVTASTGAWIDLAENNELAQPTDYFRAKDCPGVNKSIRFKTAGGPLTVQISGSYGKTIKLLVERVQ
jgi:hypothetical protein